MCSLIARGALCSVAVVLFLLPAMLLLCDGFIVRTTVGMKKKRKFRSDRKKGWKTL